MRSSQDLSYQHQRRAGKGFSIESIRILTLLSINPSSMGSFSMHCSICSCLFTKLGSSTGKVKGRATFYSLSQLCHFSATLQLCQYSTGEQVHNYSCHPKNAMGYSCDSLFLTLFLFILASYILRFIYIQHYCPLKIFPFIIMKCLSFIW